MNAEIYQISMVEFVHLLGDIPDKSAALEAAGLSSEIVVGLYNNQPLCFIGLARRTFIGDEAYIWMITTEFGEQHPFPLARHAKGFIARSLSRYSTLFGHCFAESSARWLRTLGAEFTSADTFAIRRK